MKNKFQQIFILIFLLYSCSQIDREFTNKFSSYLKINFHQELKNDCLYIVIPVLACEGCIETIINRIKSKNCISNKIIIIAVAETNAELNYITLELNEFSILKDRQNKYLKEMEYEGFYPYMIEVKNKQVVFHKEMNISSNIEKSLKLIDGY